MMSGNIPIPAPGRAGMMGGGGGVVPPVLLDESRVPRFYRDAIAACGATQQNMLPHTALVYNLMVTSGLPRSVLSYIWSAVNRTLPGQLTRPEFFSCLALIALAQKGESLAALSTMSSLPIPFLQSVQVPAVQSMSAPVVNVAKPTVPPQREQYRASSFIPTSLLLGRRNNKKKEVDLIGDVLQSPASTTGQVEGSSLPAPIPGPPPGGQPALVATRNPSANASAATPTSAVNDLCSIDWSPVAPTQKSSSSTCTSDSSRSDENASTASTFSLSFSTASEINGFAKTPAFFAEEVLDCWEKVITAAEAIFKTADKLLGQASDSVMKEIAQTERGDGYLRCLNHLFFVVRRVERSAKSELPKKCLDDIAYCTKVWERLCAFIDDLEEEDKAGAEEKPCAICCQPVSRAVYFGGQTYHSECANLWVNDVNSLLPNMHLSS